MTYIYFAFDEKYEYPIEYDVEFKMVELNLADEKIYNLARVSCSKCPKINIR